MLPHERSLCQPNLPTLCILSGILFNVFLTFYLACFALHLTLFSDKFFSDSDILSDILSGFLSDIF